MNVLGVLGLIRHFFASNGVASKVGNGVANVTAIAALAPAVIWLVTHKDEAAVTFEFTYGQLAVFGALLFFVIKIVHYSRPGNPAQRHAWPPPETPWPPPPMS